MQKIWNLERVRPKHPKPWAVSQPNQWKSLFYPTHRQGHIAIETKSFPSQHLFLSPLDIQRWKAVLSSPWESFPQRRQAFHVASYCWERKMDYQRKNFLEGLCLHMRGQLYTPTCIRNSVLKRNASLSRLPHPVKSDTCSFLFSVTLLTLWLLGKSCEVCTKRWLTCRIESPQSNTHIIICTPIHMSQPAPQK